jgi:glycosyltransferase involved in cell wall biosynthesis
VVRFTTLDLKPDDIFFFMEYLSPGRQAGNHCLVAQEMRRRGIKNKMVGLVHLPPPVLLDMHGEQFIRASADAVDRIVVMGSSLGDYFAGMGYAAKVEKTFHYVDTEYYYPIHKEPDPGRFSVIVCGSLYRDRQMLHEIMERSPGIQFELCMGMQSLAPVFGDLPNVALHGYLSEAALQAQMQRADASLSVLDDTVGSNVIVTSLACGLPQVVSDVGSIRDYCSEENAIFCRTTDDFVNGLQHLKASRGLSIQMGVNARKRAEEMSLENSIDWYRRLFTSLQRS